MNYAVIMAGGSGTRFWPVSRFNTPKQFLAIAEKRTMIQSTVDRLLPVFPMENILIIGNKVHESLLKEQLPGLKPDQIILEPFGRNTAAAIGLAAAYLKKKDPGATMLVIPSDQIIRNEFRFLEIVKEGLALAVNEKHALVTIGLKPVRPETGYGYIQIDEDFHLDNYPNAYHVKTFAEKPNYDTAVRFCSSGDFLWNSGMFIWKADTILAELQNHLPDLFLELQALEPAIGTPNFYPELSEAYNRMPNISIDYGVMEKAALVFVLKADLGWSDVGSWDEVSNLAEKDENGNSVEGNVLLTSTTNSLVRAKQKLIALVGVDDLIVIETDDSILICKKGQSQQVKNIVDQLKMGDYAGYL